MDEGRGDEQTIWFSDVFTDTAQLSAFLNAVGLELAQLASVQFQLAGPSTWRILVICRLTARQEEQRRQWEEVEAALRPRKQEVAAGGAH